MGQSTENSAAHHVGDSVVAADPPAPEQGSAPAPGAVPKQTPVTGMDGKPYQRQTPTAQRRTPLTDSIRNASTEAEKKLTTLRNLTRDDRWPQNAEKAIEGAGRGPEVCRLPPRQTHPPQLGQHRARLRRRPAQLRRDRTRPRLTTLQDSHHRGLARSRGVQHAGRLQIGRAHV